MEQECPGSQRRCERVLCGCIGLHQLYGDPLSNVNEQQLCGLPTTIYTHTANHHAHLTVCRRCVRAVPSFSPASLQSFHCRGAASSPTNSSSRGLSSCTAAAASSSSLTCLSTSQCPLVTTTRHTSLASSPHN